MIEKQKRDQNKYTFQRSEIEASKARNIKATLENIANLFKLNKSILNSSRKPSKPRLKQYGNGVYMTKLFEGSNKHGFAFKKKWATRNAAEPREK